MDKSPSWRTLSSEKFKEREKKKSNNGISDGVLFNVLYRIARAMNEREANRRNDGRKE